MQGSKIIILENASLTVYLNFTFFVQGLVFPIAGNTSVMNIKCSSKYCSVLWLAITVFKMSSWRPITYKTAIKNIIHT